MRDFLTIVVGPVGVGVIIHVIEPGWTLWTIDQPVAYQTHTLLK